jgi:hypothetical protein
MMLDDRRRDLSYLAGGLFAPTHGYPTDLMQGMVQSIA